MIGLKSLTQNKKAMVEGKVTFSENIRLELNNVNGKTDLGHVIFNRWMRSILRKPSTPTLDDRFVYSKCRHFPRIL